MIYSKNSTKKNWLIPLSGVFLGLAILTKIPSFTMIPLAVYLVYSYHKDKRLLMLLLAPVILIPMIWPTYSIVHDQFEYWKKDVLWQSQRQHSGIQNTALSFGAIDPALFGLGIAGVVYSVIRKNIFVLLWIIPFVIFLSLIGYTQYFHWMLILPGLCVAAAILISDLGKNHTREKIKQHAPILSMVVIASFGILSTVVLLGLDVTANQFESAVFAANYATNHNRMVLAGPHHSWIYNGVLEMNLYQDYSALLFDNAPSDYVLLADPHFHLDSYRGDVLERVYNSTTPIKSFAGMKSNYDVYQYPYSSLGYNYDAGLIEVRSSSDVMD